ncbi:hypothetical protein BFP97_12245 [Roseivirga sp. 4D4]|uniref:patatin-like phospholipase family protein n=1 Tax=Roseivirga sp. 4D4 TaxID=1889784 RepID=UPI0008539113|nr:patatin family protein [Roseivirga sp. 4D4]OEK02239.1 hypothetical protein BFP97_12245 [Roseivirga sp. 4D4]
MKALIVEGGAMRGIFSSGILEAFMSKDYYPFDCYIGVSAGACNLASYLTKTVGRNYNGYVTLMAQPKFISWRRFLKGGDLLDLNWLWDELDSKFPIDERRLEQIDSSFYCVTTEVASGRARYLKPNKDNIHTYLMASSNIPLACRNFVDIDGQDYSDGGASDPIPVQFAIDKGAKEILVLRSQKADYRSKNTLFNHVWNFFLRKYPKLKKQLDLHDRIYNDALDLIENPPEGVSIQQITPDTLHTSRTSQDKTGLNKDFEHGFAKGIEFMKSVQQ